MERQKNEIRDQILHSAAPHVRLYKLSSLNLNGNLTPV